MTVRRVAVVGGGIVGLAAAYRLLLARPEAAVTVLEKERAVGLHQSGHNSGVLHAGLTYRPGSFKARLAVAGIRDMVRFCRAHGVPHSLCGKLVIATREQEVPWLRELQQRGEANGLRGVTWLGADRIREIEPHALGLAALHVPEEGVVDYGLVCHALVDQIRALGGEVKTAAAVYALRRQASGWVIATTAGEISAGFLLNCAGLHSDRIARLAGEHPTTQIIPFRGEYVRLRPERSGLVRHLIYPVPDPAFPFLGVHLTRRIDGNVDGGPSAVLAFSREGYGWGTMELRDLTETACFPGVWRFLAGHPRMCARELARSVSRRAFATALRRLVPEIEPEDLVPAGAGVRAQAMTREGALVDDFLFLERADALHVLNAPSPGATASLAIGEVIAHRCLGTVGGPVAVPVSGVG
jgi:L-2-hydroxyglutarate oxidase